MITLFRIIRKYQLKVKWELAIWQFLDQQLMTIIKNPEEIEKKFIPYLAKLAHDESIKEKAKEVMGTFGEK